MITIHATSNLCVCVYVSLFLSCTYLLPLEHGPDVRRVDAFEVDGAQESVRVRRPRDRVQREPREHDLQHALLAHVHREVAFQEVLKLRWEVEMLQDEFGVEKMPPKMLHKMPPMCSVLLALSSNPLIW